MALSQVALNVFYLFNGRKILSCPKGKPHTRALRLHGDVSVGGDVNASTYVHPSAATLHLGSGGSAAWQWVGRGWSHVLCAAGFGCQRCQAGEGWASLGFQLPMAPWSLGAVTALGGQSSATGHSLKRLALSESKANGTWARISWRRDPVDTVLQRLLPALLYVCPIRYLFLQPNY